MTNRTYTIWRALLFSVTVIGLAVIVGDMVWSDDKGKLHKGEVIAMATSVKITIAGAAETALGHIAGQVIEAELQKRGGTIIWDVEVLTAEQAIMTVYVDAVSGAVILTEEKGVEKGTNPKKTVGRG